MGFCKENDVGILVVDTFTAFAKLHGSDENISGEIIERMVPVLEAARVHGLHVSILHHTGKDGEIRGSTAFWKDPDIIWTLKRPPGDHGPNVRALVGNGRYDSVNTTFNIALEDDGYVLLGTNGQIERAKAKSALLEAVPVGKENRERRTVVFEKLKGVASEPTLRRALEHLVDAQAVHEEKTTGRGNPTVLWRPSGKPVTPAEDLFPSDPQGIGLGSDGNKTRPSSSSFTARSIAPPTTRSKRSGRPNFTDATCTSERSLKRIVEHHPIDASRQRRTPGDLGPHPLARGVGLDANQDLRDALEVCCPLVPPIL